MNFRNCTYAGVLLALLLGCSGSALAASETSVSNAVQIGEPVLLSESQVREAAEKFGVTGYGLAG